MMHTLRFAAAYTALRFLRFTNRGLNDVQRRWLLEKVMKERDLSDNIQLDRLLNYRALSGKRANYNIEQNGELALLKKLVPLAPRIVFDVGANIGDWSIEALTHLYRSHVHAFEIIPATYQTLSRRLIQVRDRVTANAFGLGDVNGEITIFTRPDFSERASVIRDAVDYRLTSVESIEPLSEPLPVVGQLRTGDSYLTEVGVQRIDLLKIDVEGAELSVLNGFSNAFENQIIDVVQFEYGPLNLMTRHFLKDFYTFFEQRGFAIGKLYPNGVEFAPYSYELEDFVGPNYVACHHQRTDIMAAITRPDL